MSTVTKPFHYDYGGDAKRRERVSGGVTTWYNDDVGWNLLNEEDDSGDLALTYIHDPMRPIGTVMADLASATPSTGTVRYYSQDNIGSTRRLRDASKGSLGQYEYEPYGDDYIVSGASVLGKYVGYDRDETSQTYYTPYRYYIPNLARWASRDPLGLIDGPDMFSFVRCNPISRVDPLGLATEAECYDNFQKCTRNAYGTFAAYIKGLGIVGAGGLILTVSCPSWKWRGRCLG